MAASMLLLCWALLLSAGLCNVTTTPQKQTRLHSKHDTLFILTCGRETRKRNLLKRFSENVPTSVLPLEDSAQAIITHPGPFLSVLLCDLCPESLSVLDQVIPKMEEKISDMVVMLNSSLPDEDEFSGEFIRIETGESGAWHRPDAKVISFRVKYIPKPSVSLEGVTLRVGLPRKIRDEKKYIMAVFDTLQERLRFKVIEVEVDSFYSLNEKLDYDKIDIGVFLTMSASRVAQYDFTQPVNANDAKLYYIKPEGFGVSSIPRAALNIEPWTLFLATMALLALALAMIHVCRKRFEDDDPEGHHSLTDCLFWALSAICQQGSQALPTFLSARTVFIVGYFLASIFFTLFSAISTSVLSAAPKNEMTLKDMADYDMQLAYIGGYTGDWVNGSAEIFGKMLKNWEEQQCPNVSSCVTMFLESGGKLAYLGPQHSVDLLLNENSEKYSYLINKISTLNMDNLILNEAYIFKKGSPYKEQFNRGIAYMMSSGLLSRLKKLMLATFYPSDTVRPNRVDLEEIMPFVYIFLLGLVLSLFILQIETCWLCTSRSVPKNESR